MANLRYSIGGERQRWVEIHTDEDGNWEYRVVNIDGETEYQSDSNLSSREEAEEHVEADEQCDGLDIYVGPNPLHWEQRPVVTEVEVIEDGEKNWVEDDGKKKGKKRIRRGGRSIPTGRV
jgi:hypothetical protein